MPEPADRDDAKQQQLESVRVRHDGTALTTDQGVQVGHTDDSLTAGDRGPTIMDDFHFREKITRFDHERIPERVVHARGSAAYGYFECYEPLTRVTRAHFLGAAGRRTPVFVRFSTVAGSRGSADTVRDVRGFATKFYTQEGNFDIVGNNMPIFFIQDGIKFPDFVHAVKPEPHNEMPQASSAHNTLWDFVAQQPETMHMMMWLMSDRALPRSYRMMQGFGVHTFRLVSADGVATFVKWHWRPRLGTHSLIWDEAQTIAGKDPDFNRRDLWEAIESGNYPEYELCVQLVDESREHDFAFDLLDPTKIIPEEQVPLRPVGRMVLDRNPDNFFAETEQVAFHLGNIVPGVDFTNDPLLQGRLFSYLDTQLIRLGGPNFAQLPVNRPIAEVHHHQRDGYGQHRIDVGQTSYHKNSLGGGCPAIATDGAFHHYEQQVSGRTIRDRSPSFADHFSQARLFWNSMSGWERQHIISAYLFELGKVDHPEIRQKVVDHLSRIDDELASAVAQGLGMNVPKPSADGHDERSPALSQAEQSGTPETRKVAVLVGDGVTGEVVRSLVRQLTEHGAVCELLASHDGTLETDDGSERLAVDRALATMSSVLYDAVLVAPGAGSVSAVRGDGEAVHYIVEAFKHRKTIGALGDGVGLLRESAISATHYAADPADGVVDDVGVITAHLNSAGISDFVAAFSDSVAKHRHYTRDVATIPA